MKTTYPLRFLLIPLCLLWCSGAFAFQIADGTPPSAMPAAKYIFYWGKYQCDLSEGNGYKSALALTPAAFRQVLLGAPKVWNGKDLVKNLTFKLEGVTVTTMDYLGQLASLDAALSPKVLPGNVLHLTDLTLEAGIGGVIDISITTDGSGEAITLFGNSPMQNSAMLNEQFLDRVVWGREDIYENPDRDFFTVREFWQTIQQEPAVEWKSYLKPQTLRCVVTFTSKDKASMGVVQRLEEGAYSQLLEQLNTYRHLIQPGANVLLELQTAEQYDKLYKKTMYLVADDDPRLRLRQKRDQHTMKLIWEPWSQLIPNVYLSQLSTPQGETILADEPIAMSANYSYEEEQLDHFGKTAPICLIDGEPVSGDLSFRVRLSDSTVFYVHSNNYEADSIARFFTLGAMNTKFTIDSIQLENYPLPAMAFSTTLLKRPYKLLAPNELNVLKILAAAPTPRIKLHEPTFSPSELAFRFELPDKSPVIFSIYEADGWYTYTEDDIFPAGESTLRVPRNVFRNKGKHTLYINSAFGVAKLEFEVE